MANIAVTAANVLAAAGAQIDNGRTSTAAITVGQTVYLDATTNTYKLADADLSAAAGKLAGVALSATPGTGGQPISVLTGGNYNPGGTVVVGTVYVLSATAGALCPAADLASGMYSNILGIATTASNILVGILNSGVAVP